jgi:hypothetical protein
MKHAKFATTFLLFALLLAQGAWAWHVNGKFNTCKQHWEAAKVRWEDARARGDINVQKTAYEDEALYFRAEMRAQRDMIISPLRWRERWHADYIAEAKAE